MIEDNRKTTSDELRQFKKGAKIKLSVSVDKANVEYIKKIALEYHDNPQLNMSALVDMMIEDFANELRIDVKEKEKNKRNKKMPMWEVKE